eukprot:scpid79589/ scgid3020/ 
MLGACMAAVLTITALLVFCRHKPVRTKTWPMDTISSNLQQSTTRTTLADDSSLLNETGSRESEDQLSQPISITSSAVDDIGEFAMARKKNRTNSIDSSHLFIQSDSMASIGCVTSVASKCGSASTFHTLALADELSEEQHSPPDCLNLPSRKRLSTVAANTNRSGSTNSITSTSESHATCSTLGDSVVTDQRHPTASTPRKQTTKKLRNGEAGTIGQIGDDDMHDMQNEISKVVGDRLFHTFQCSNPTCQTVKSMNDTSYCYISTDVPTCPSKSISSSDVNNSHTSCHDTGPTSVGGGCTPGHCVECEEDLQPDEFVSSVAWQNMAVECADGNPGLESFSGQNDTQPSTKRYDEGDTEVTHPPDNRRMTIFSNIARKIWARRLSRASTLGPKIISRSDTVDSTLDASGWDLEDESGDVGMIAEAEKEDGTTDDEPGLYYSCVHSALANNGGQQSKA